MNRGGLNFGQEKQHCDQPTLDIPRGMAYTTFNKCGVTTARQDVKTIPVSLGVLELCRYIPAFVTSASPTTGTGFVFDNTGERTMGCDIHGAVECGHNNYWWSFAILHLNRDYVLFAALAGVRRDNPAPIIQPRGYPPNLSSAAKREAMYYISEIVDEGYIDTATADKYLANGWSVRYGSNYITKPDFHTPSWVTTDELRHVIDSYSQWCIDNQEKPSTEIQAVYAIMVQLETTKGKNNVRFVFWFDN